MMRSMFSGVSGLKTHQLKMDVIGNNIANVNTVGFKSSRVTFKEVFAQTISGASAADPDSGRGGVNPMQVGLGVNLGSIDTLMTQGAAQRTDNTMDLMIDGEAFFIVSDATETFFTRNGATYVDEYGNLTLSGTNGLLVNGWYAIPGEDDNGMPTGEYVIDRGLVQPIQIIGEYEYITPSCTTAIDFSGNLNGTTAPEVTRQVSFYDSLGNRYLMDIKFEMDEVVDSPKGTMWNFTLGDEIYPDGDRTKGIPVTWGTGGTGGSTGVLEGAANGSIFFNSNGKMPSSKDIAEDASVLPTDCYTGVILGLSDADFGTDADGNPLLIPNATFEDIKIDFSGLTQFSGSATSNPTSRTLDGSSAGNLTRLSIDDKGIITGSYSNGETKMIAQIAVTTFDNSGGLEKAGSNLYRQTRNSGEFRPSEANTVTETGGSFIVGSLEMSNVDLSTEFTEMITTQRGFQANSRTITVSDEMLQELINLKR